MGLLCLSIALPLAHPALAQSCRGPVGHWTLDEIGPRNFVADSTRSGWHAACGASGAVCSVPGKLGRAARFPAAGTISLDRHAAALGKLTSFSVSMWIQYEGGPSRQLFTFSDGSMNRRLQMEVHGGQLHFGWQNGGGFAAFSTPPLAWKEGTWYHVVFVNDSKAGKSILRSNDLVWKTDPNTLSPAELKSPVKRAAIGSLNGEYAFNGCVDDVRLFDRALSLAEQLALEEEVNGQPADPGLAAARKALIAQQRRMQTGRATPPAVRRGRGAPPGQERLSAKSRVAFPIGRRRSLDPRRQRTRVDPRDDRPAAAASQRPGLVAGVGGTHVAGRTSRRLRNAARAVPSPDAVFRRPGVETKGDAEIVRNRLLDDPLRRRSVSAPQPRHARDFSSKRVGSRKPVPQRDVRLARREGC